MYTTPKVIIDTQCEIYSSVKQFTDGLFWDIKLVDLDYKNTLYIFGRYQFSKNLSIVKQIMDQSPWPVILANPSEGSETLKNHCQFWGVTEYAHQKKLLLISGGDMDDSWEYLHCEYFLPRILDYRENLLAQQRSNEIFEKSDKPYKFLFLNGYARPHRKYLYEQFQLTGILDSALWTMLDVRPAWSREISLQHNGKNLSSTTSDLRWLPPQYEIDKFHNNSINLGQAQTQFLKSQLFNNQWGEVYLKPEAYIDTYFSLVTETVFTYPHSFRTEKIWKPIVMGHPWIAVSGYGYYRDMHNLGFKTFGHVIDESFDLIQDPQLKIEKIASIVQDLCTQDLTKFLEQCQDVCKYNQYRYSELRDQVTREFPNRFTDFLNKQIQKISTPHAHN